ncbi:MAG TPA: WGR domain-containing protein, partial [Kofleriaceae bacterium]|nr:WGR domain-containing protein [Kofleriaceae bacterium]
MQRFELTAGTSSKFWAIEQRGRSITVRFGRIGTEGQTKVTSFATASEAQIAHDKLVAEKRRKGYAPAGRGNVPTVKAPRTSQARRTVTKAKTPDSPATTTKRAATRAPTSERPLRFVLQNKSSTKHAD